MVTFFLVLFITGITLFSFLFSDANREEKRDREGRKE
jgi:hypothetical protein